MEANRDWWGWEGKAPSFDRVIWKPIPEDFPRIVALDKGEVDIITNVPPDQVKAIESGRLTRVVTTPATRFVAFTINSTQPPLSDKRVRQALHYALDVNADRQEPLRRPGQAVQRRARRHRLRLQRRAQAVSVRRRPGRGSSSRMPGTPMAST